MRLFCMLFLVFFVGCSSVEEKPVEIDETAAQTVEKPEVGFVYLFDVLQQHPRSGLGIFDDWVVVRVNNSVEKSIWSFPPVTHPAFPAAVQREIIDTGSGISIETRVNCLSGQVLCEQFFRDYIAMSAKVLGK